MKSPQERYLMGWHHQRRSFVLGGAAWLLSGVSVVIADDLRPIRRSAHRVQPLCSLPPADYQHGARSPSVIVRSRLAIPLTRPELIGEAVAIIRDSISDPTTVGQMPLPIPTPLNVPSRIPTPPYVDDARLLQQLANRDYAESVVDAVASPSAKLILLGTREMAVLHCEISDIAILLEKNGRWHMSLRADQNPSYRRSDSERNLELHIKRNAFHVNVRLLQSSRVGGTAIGTDTLTPSNVEQAGKLAVAAFEIQDFWVEREAPAFITRQGFDPIIARQFHLVDQAEIEFYVRLDPLTGNGRGVVNPWHREP